MKHAVAAHTVIISTPCTYSSQMGSVCLSVCLSVSTCPHIMIKSIAVRVPKLSCVVAICNTVGLIPS